MFLKERARITMFKKTWKEIRVLFSGWELLFHLIWLFLLNYAFFYFTSENFIVSMCVGVVGALFFFFNFTYRHKKLNQYQTQLKELLKYITNMIFFMGTGENVLHALKAARSTVSSDIRKDIDRTIESLESKAVLDTDHFKKYAFPSLDQFHRNLLIKYERGGDVNDLFKQIRHNMMFELTKRDELHKRKKTFALNVYVLLGMVSFIMILLRLIVSELWEIFLSVSIAGIVVLLLTYGAILFNLYVLQKKKMDISVRL
ncbi:hypothetical protein B1A98_18415 [Bacillus badius]|nr:hypothetical protein A6M11_14530 [Bacillus badius]OVE47540.1 hypothetical protein B1A98_18415 [Bacillus badius]